MRDPPYILDASARLTVLSAIREVCSFRNWTLLAAHVRSTHVHSVVEAEVPPEKVLNDFKSYATRNLNKTGNLIENAGHAMAAPAGCLKTNLSARRSGM